MSKYVKLNIVDGYADLDEDIMTRVIDSFILINPNESKLDKLRELIDEWSDLENEVLYKNIYRYVCDNFEQLNIEEIEIEFW